MKPKPMSDARFKELAGRQSACWHGDSLIGSEQIAGFASAIIAARDAQWAAMIGEPVAWYLPGEGGDDSIFRDRHTVAACNGNPWTGFLPLYAIKEAP